MSAPFYWTKGMVRGMRTLPVTVTIKVRPLIRRRSPPAVGSCSFDDAGRVVYVIANPSVRRFVWHRVTTTGMLSRETYCGELGGGG